MLGNMGITELAIVLIVLMVFFGVPLMLTVVLWRRSVRQGLSEDDRAQLQRILASLENMERRIENLETVMMQRGGKPGE